MSSTLEVLLISTLALHQAATIIGFAEPLDSGHWSPMVLEHSQAYVLLHRVEESLERINDGAIKERIKDFVELQLFVCTENGVMNENCVTRITVAVMAYIHHQATGEPFEYDYGSDE